MAAKNTLESVIGIDTDREIVSLYSMDGADKNSITCLTSGFKARPFTPEFYDKLNNIIGQFREDHPNAAMQKVTVVLPDIAVLTDMVNLPIIDKKAMDSSLAASLSNLYGNSSDLKFNRVLANQTRQMATYAITAVRKDILLNIQRACSEHQLNVDLITFSASAATNAAMTLNPKLKGASFVLLDIKEEYARLVFVVKGKTLGFYTLPFGYKTLYKTRVMAEDLIFDHSSAEQLIFAAKAKAKAKNASLEDEESADVIVEDEPELDMEEDDELEFPNRRKADEEDEEDEELERELAEVEAEEADAEAEGDLGGKKFKKSARKLPKFMLRPTPTNREGYMYENFRLFVKWTLEFISSNPAIHTLGYPEAVYVNMPEEYNFLYEMVNLEEEDNGVRFVPLFEEETDVVKKNLELYGGFFAKSYNGFNNFHGISAPAAKHTVSTAQKPAAAQEQQQATAEAKPDFKETLKKIGEAIKKIATYEIGGSK